MKLIDKDALVAEIERLEKKNNESENAYDFGTEHTLKSILSFISTLEVKEVDLEKELEDWLGERIGKWTGKECERMCLHFFELGLKVNQKGE